MYIGNSCFSLHRSYLNMHSGDRNILPLKSIKFNSGYTCYVNCKEKSSCFWLQNAFKYKNFKEDK